MRLSRKHYIGGWLLACILVPEIALFTISAAVAILFGFFVLYPIYTFIRMFRLDSSDNGWYNANALMGYHRTYDGLPPGPTNGG